MTMSMRSRMIYKALKAANIKGSCGRRLKTGVDKNASEYPSKFDLRGLTIEVKVFESRNVFIIKKKDTSSQRHMIYLHGGGYVCQSSAMHWSFVTDFTRRTALEVCFLDYPLAPEYHSGKALDFVYNYYCQHLKTYDPDSVLIMGDSAGGGLTLSLLMKIRNENIKMPEKAILISPFVDSEVSDRRQRDIDLIDPILSVEELIACGIVYAGELSLKDWRVNPVKGDFKGLCPLSIYTGDNDILHIDAIRLKEKLDLSNQPYTYHFEPGMLHVWPLFPGLPEAGKAREQITKEVNKPDKYDSFKTD